MCFVRMKDETPSIPQTWELLVFFMELLNFIRLSSTEENKDL